MGSRLTLLHLISRETRITSFLPLRPHPGPLSGPPAGVALALWEAPGLALITLSSIYILDEPFSLQRLAGLLCALSGALLVHHGTVQDKDTSSDTSRTAS